MFVENSRSNLEAIRAAIATNDYQKVALEAHSIKGSSGNIGATIIMQTAEKLEQLNKKHNLQGVSDLLTELVKFINKIQEFIDNKSNIE